MSDLEVTVEDGVATLTMNRPEARNAFSIEMREALDQAFHDFEYDDAVRCVVLTGAGEHFMAGGDIKSFHRMAGEQDAEQLGQHFIHRIHDLHSLMFAMRRVAKPTIASVRGAAAGAGVSLALACDLVIAAEDAFFTLAYCHIGLSPDGSATYSLPRAVGLKKAMEITLLGDRYDAAAAKDMGLVNFVVPTAELAAETAALATRLANGPTIAYANARRLLYQSLHNQFETQLQAEAEAFRNCAMSADFREGVAAFVEKRKPSFTVR
ncbi:MAG: enoyl-CoA hydratase [Alphaproteobacteria bacterium]|nr:enoyl-CoA hydratase [Alphaproteobacteria bacterium]